VYEFPKNDWLDPAMLTEHWLFDNVAELPNTAAAGHPPASLASHTVPAPAPGATHTSHEPTALGDELIIACAEDRSAAPFASE
jgi:hypothetical protein